MLDRLKSLPLTIVLTVLIWMYAESQVTSQQAQLEVPGVPVLVSFPPELLSRYEVVLETKSVTVTVLGSGVPIDALRSKIRRNEETGIFAHLNIEAGDLPAPTKLQRQLQFALPEGITLLSYPAEAAYYLKPRAAASAPAAVGQ